MRQQPRCILALLVLQSAQCFVLDGGQNCPVTCECSGTYVDCRSDILTSLTPILQNLPREVDDMFLMLNNVTTISDKALSEFTRLKEFHFFGQSLKTMGRDIFANLISLEKIGIHSPKLLELPLLGIALSNLTELDLTFSNVTTLTDDFLWTTGMSLTTLRLSYTNLHGWPAALEYANVLQVLRLEGNPNMGDIPHGAFDSFQHTLAELNLNNTGLTHLPPGIEHLVNLQQLHLSNNPIGDRGFPDEAFGSGAMAVRLLVLRNTSITRIPLAVCSLSSLQSLDLSGNNIQVISEEQVSCIKHIEQLVLRNCGLLKIPSSFRSLNQLWDMSLSGNPLRSVEYYDLSGLSNLTSLVLDNASLSYISPGAFQWTPSLRYLFLRHNAITEMPVAFTDLSKNVSISMSANPMQCSCDMKWVDDWMKNSSINIDGNCGNHLISLAPYIGTFLPRCPP